MKGNGIKGVSQNMSIPQEIRSVIPQIYCEVKITFIRASVMYT